MHAPVTERLVYPVTTVRWPGSVRLKPEHVRPKRLLAGATSRAMGNAAGRSDRRAVPPWGRLAVPLCPTVSIPSDSIAAFSRSHLQSQRCFSRSEAFLLAAAPAADQMPSAAVSGYLPAAPAPPPVSARFVAHLRRAVAVWRRLWRALFGGVCSVAGQPLSPFAASLH